MNTCSINSILTISMTITIIIITAVRALLIRILHQFILQIAILNLLIEINVSTAIIIKGLLN